MDGGSSLNLLYQDVRYRVPEKPLRFELWGVHEDLPPTDPRPNALLRI